MKQHYRPILILICLSIIPLLGLFHDGLPLTHDGQDHVARIANFYMNLQEGTFIPRWAGNLNWGYGHPVLMFLYPLPSYLASVFHSLGFSFVDAVKLVFGITFIASGITMYLWVRTLWDETAGLVAGCFYMLAPYRFVDLYVRGAIGEHVAFVFPPLILYCMVKLSKKNSYRYIVGGSISLAGLILAHNAISLMFLPLLIAYAGYVLFTTKKKQLLYQYIGILILGFGLATFFWLPAFAEGKYTLRDIVTAEDYASRFVPVKDFFYGVWSYGGTDLLSKQVGIAHWVMIGIACLLSVKHWKKQRLQSVLSFALLGIFVLTLFIMTEFSAFIWHVITVLQKFQFPWRFLSVVVFAAAALAGYVAAHIPSGRRFLFGSVIIASVFLANMPYWHAKGYLHKPEAFYTGIYNSTTDTGESAPVWSVRFMEKRPNAHLEVIDGNATIHESRRTSTVHEYSISASTQSRIRENTLYFPGWSVLVNGKPVPIEFQDPMHRGLMTFFVESGVHGVRVQFTETKLRTLANLASGGSLLILFAWGILEKQRLWRRYR